MKRFFFSLIALSAAAIGCTQSALVETPDFGGTEISFSPYTGRTPETKAQSIEGPGGVKDVYGLAEAGGFQVIGYLNDDMTTPYMNKTVISTDGANWSYTGAVYWPDSNSGSTLDFVAYSANAASHLSNLSSTGFTFTVPSVVDNQVDLLATAYQSGYKVNTTGVTNGNLELEFYHLLSRVGFKIQATQTTKPITIKNLSFSGYMPTKGVLDFQKANTPATATTAQKKIPSLTATSDKSTARYEYVKDNTVANTSNLTTDQRISGTEGKYLMIMPHTILDSDHFIEVEYVVGNSSSRTSKIELPIGFEFAAGKAYEFILEISNSSLQFTVEEDPWDSSEHTTEIDKPQPMPDQPTPEPEPEPGPEPEIVPDDSAIHFSSNGAEGTIRVSRIAVTSASLEVQISKKVTGEALKTSLIGVAYRTEGTNNWTEIPMTNQVTQTPTIINLTQLIQGTTYEYCIYTGYKGNITQNVTKTYGDTHIFTTLVPETPPAPPKQTPPTVTLNNIIHSTVTSNSAIVSGEFAHGIYDGGETEGIKEYGFCWIRGNGTPSIYSDAKKFTNSNNQGLDNPGTFSHTIQNLKPNTLYSCSSYVVTNSGGVYYSTVHTFTTKPFVKDDNNDNIPDDDTGGNWGSEGEANPENQPN